MLEIYTDRTATDEEEFSKYIKDRQETPQELAVKLHDALWPGANYFKLSPAKREPYINLATYVQKNFTRKTNGQ